MGSIVSTCAFQPPLYYPQFEQNDDIVLIPYHDYYNDIDEDMKIPALWFKSPEAKYTIIFSHGNASDITSSYLSTYGKWLRDNLNVNVLIYEYMGYGWTTEINNDVIKKYQSYTSSFIGGDLFEPSEKNTYSSVRSSYNYLVNDCNISEESIIVFGHSLGTGPSCYLASIENVGGLILKSPLLSAIRVAYNIGITLPFDIFPNIKNITKIKCPVFLIHGQEDNVINHSHSVGLKPYIKNLYKLWSVPDCGHCDIDSHDKMRYLEELKGFIDSL